MAAAVVVRLWRQMRRRVAASASRGWSQVVGREGAGAAPRRPARARGGAQRRGW
jgi:hypothetical protein